MAHKKRIRIVCDSGAAKNNCKKQVDGDSETDMGAMAIAYIQGWVHWRGRDICLECFMVEMRRADK